MDGFVAATDYERKYAIRLLHGEDVSSPPKNRPSAQQYGEQVRQALVVLWCAANKICSKRLVPFLPELIKAMEKYGHLRLSCDVRAQLLRISPATVDRILKSERDSIGQGVSTTY